LLFSTLLTFEKKYYANKKSNCTEDELAVWTRTRIRDTGINANDF
jgi:hypothetical protein